MKSALCTVPRKISRHNNHESLAPRCTIKDPAQDPLGLGMDYCSTCQVMHSHPIFSMLISWLPLQWSIHQCFIHQLWTIKEANPSVWTLRAPAVQTTRPPPGTTDPEARCPHIFKLLHQWCKVTLTPPPRWGKICRIKRKMWQLPRMFILYPIQANRCSTTGWSKESDNCNMSLAY